MTIPNLTIITLNHPSIIDFAAERNALLKEVKTPWVLFLDADESLTPQLKSEIAKAINSDDYSAYYLKRRDTFLGRDLKHGETGHARFLRLAKKDFGTWQRPVHERWVGQGRVGQLSSPLLHHPHATVSSFLAKINLYSTLEAEYRFKQSIKSSLFKIALYPLAKFKWNYFVKLGFLDGTPGAIMAIMMSFHSYLTWTKLFLLWQKHPERSRRI